MGGIPRSRRLSASGLSHEAGGVCPPRRNSRCVSASRRTPDSPGFLWLGHRAGELFLGLRPTLTSRRCSCDGPGAGSRNAAHPRCHGEGLPTRGRIPGPRAAAGQNRGRYSHRGDGVTPAPVGARPRATAQCASGRRPHHRGGSTTGAGAGIDAVGDQPGVSPGRLGGRGPRWLGGTR